MTLPEQTQSLQAQIAEMRGAIAALESPLDPNIPIQETAPLAFLKSVIDAEHDSERAEENRLRRLAQAKEAVRVAENELARLQQLEAEHRKTADEGWGKLKTLAQAWQKTLDEFEERFDSAKSEMMAIAAECIESERAIHGATIPGGPRPRARQNFVLSQYFDNRWGDALPSVEIVDDGLRRVSIGRQELTRQIRLQREFKKRLEEAQSMREKMAQPSSEPEQAEPIVKEAVPVSFAGGVVEEFDE
ncbi:MAG: hypothetical protein WBA57_27490 [Elainellaceae cyanobacterium]